MIAAAEVSPGVRVLRGRVVAQLVRRGWRPPPLRDDQAHRLLDDMIRLAGDLRGVQPRNESLGLTPRERLVLGLVAEGLTAPEIAERLGRAADTVRKQEARIRAKLGARNNAHAAAMFGRESI